MGFCAAPITSSSGRYTCINLNCEEEQDERKIVQQRMPNVSVYDNMAPALTEPLSQTSKLSSSTTSASPRPTSNSLLITSSEHSESSENNNINSNLAPLESTKDTTLNGAKVKDTAHKGTFQLAFERVVAKQTAAAAAEREKQLKNEVIGTLSNGPVANKQMGPMCDTNSMSSNAIILDDQLAENQENTEGDDEEESKNLFKEVEEEAVLAKELNIENHHMDVETIIEGNHEDNIDEKSNEVEEIVFVTTNDAVQRHSEKADWTSAVDVDSTMCVILSDSEEDNESNKTEKAGRTDSSNTQDSTSCTNTQNILTSTTGAADIGDNVEVSLTSESTILKSPETQTLTSSPQQDSQIQLQTPISTIPLITGQSTSTTMGLQKDFIKETSEMDQVLGDMDLLQVLKGFDTNPSGESLCDLAGSLVFFNDVDVMNYEEMSTPVKDNESKEVRAEIEKRHLQMQRKCDFLLRRLKKMQSRYMGKHTTEEIAGMFEWTNRIVRRKDHEHSRPISYEEDKHRPVTTASMRVLLKRIDTVATAQHTSQSKKGKVIRLSGPSTIVTAEPSKPPATSIVPRYDEKTTEEFDRVSGMLQTELKQVQHSLDSDVTASSSGGESADEMVTYNNQVQQPLSISKRAAWRWARDRSAIASRWTWLLTQISDLEYRIRQHSELHHQIKRNKGAVTFEKLSSTANNCSGHNISGSVNTPIPGDNNNSATLSMSSVNGYRGMLPGNSKSIDADNVPPNGAYDAASTNSAGSCRTRSFLRAGFRKRKLLQTANVHTVSKKAARPSTVKCGCKWPMHPCALCTGRSDPTAPRDYPDTMTPSERVALLDPGFHPVLSFPEDVSNSIHLEATLRSPDWQNRVLRCSSKSILKGAVATQKAAEREDRSKKYLDGRRKYNRKFSSQDIMAANKLKNAKNRRALLTSHVNNHLIKSKQRKLLSGTNAGGGSTIGFRNNIGGGVSGNGKNNSGVGSVNGIPYGINEGNISSTFSGGVRGASSSSANDRISSFGGIDNFDNSNCVLPRSKNSSPTPGNYSGNFRSERMDRRNRNSYDIDNIVIPYSVAAATRVEILPYKEIPTPKWRVIDNDEHLEASTTGVQDESTSSQDDTLKDTEYVSEDISNDAIHKRHERALMEERKKFQTFLKFPWSTRSRANRRIDSRAESSGANTPDPTSPAPNTPSATGDQESIPSPAAPSTPQTPQESVDGVDTTVCNLNPILTPGNFPTNSILSSAARRAERRRTISQKKEREYKEETRRSSTPDLKEIFPPFDPLQFPLTEELYDEMLKMMPNSDKIIEDCLKSDLVFATTEQPNLYTKGHMEGDDNHQKDVSQCDLNVTFQLATTSRNNNMHNSLMLQNKMATFDTEDSLLMDVESETDSADSVLQEDPNDPEWREAA